MAGGQEGRRKGRFASPLSQRVGGMSLPVAASHGKWPFPDQCTRLGPGLGTQSLPCAGCRPAHQDHTLGCLNGNPSPPSSGGEKSKVKVWVCVVSSRGPSPWLAHLLPVSSESSLWARLCPNLFLRDTSHTGLRPHRLLTGHSAETAGTRGTPWGGTKASRAGGVRHPTAKLWPGQLQAESLYSRGFPCH